MGRALLENRKFHQKVSSVSDDVGGAPPVVAALSFSLSAFCLANRARSSSTLDIRGPSPAASWEGTGEAAPLVVALAVVVVAVAAAAAATGAEAEADVTAMAGVSEAGTGKGEGGEEAIGDVGTTFAAADTGDGGETGRAAVEDEGMNSGSPPSDSLVL